MRITWGWLREALGTEIPVPPEALAERLLGAGLDLSSIERAAGCSGVVTARILEVRPHPNADRLRIAKVTDGKTTREVVCGAPNIAAGQVVPWAQVGATLAGGLKIQEAAIRGVPSPGMLCSLKELGIGENHSGIWVLDESSPLGASVADLAGLEDAVLDFEITPNRPDWLSVLGLAREAAAVLNLKTPHVPIPTAPATSLPFYPVEIEDEAGCLQYIARRFEGVAVGPSDPRVQVRLLRAGIRPINNIVDITNLVLLGSGHPLHAFDADKLEGGKIVVRRARPGEKLLALDGKAYDLDPEVLVIADAARPVAIAGVMGGEGTAVTGATRNVLLESAVFDRRAVRRAKAKLNLASESSYRFERGVTPYSCRTASALAGEEIEKQRGRLVAYSDSRSGRFPKEKPTVTLRFARVQKILGEPVEPSEIGRVFQKLEIPILTSNSDSMVVQAPDWRLDLEQEIDFVEEIARIQGYGQVPSGGAVAQISQALEPVRAWRFRKKAQAALEAIGFHETCHYGLVSGKEIEAAGLSDRAVELENPLSEDQSFLRPALGIELLKNAAKNRAYQKRDVRLYEVGAVSQKLGGDYRETLRVAAVACGKVHPETWQDPKPGAVDFFWIKGALQTLLRSCCFSDREWSLVPLQGSGADTGAGWPDLGSWLHPGLAFRVRTSVSGESAAGYVGQVHPRIAKEWDLDPATFLFECDLDALHRKGGEEKVRPISLFPSIRRDCSVWVKEEIAWEEMRREIEEAGGKLLRDLTLFDVYRDPQSPGRKSLSFALTFQHLEKTLEDEAANQGRDKILKALHRKFGAELRQK